MRVPECAEIFGTFYKDKNFKQMKTQIVTKEKIQKELIDFLCLQFYVEKEDIELDESLVDEGIIDSMGLIEIAAFIKEQYNIEVTEEQMTKTNFGSVLKIVDFISIELEK